MKKKLILLAMLGFQLSAKAQLPNYVPTGNLAGWWSFSGNANDQSGNNRHGTVSGAALSADRMGNANSAYLFNGTSDKITVTPTGITQVSKATVAAWVKYTGNANASRSYDTYFQFGEHPSNTFACSYDFPNKNMNMYRACQGSWLPQANIDNQWHHIVMVQDSVTTKLYIDGLLLATKISSTPLCYSGTNGLVLGAAPTDLQWMTGSLDDIGFWTRALTECEITSLFNSTPPLAITTQPVSQSGNAGTAVTFSVTVSGSSATYQWQSNIGPGGTFMDLPNAGQYSGVTSNTLTVSSLTAINNNQLFRCIVTGGEASCGSITSNVVSVGVSTTGINDHEYFAGSALEQNIPNPASDNTVINYYVRSFKHNASILVCDAGGRKVWSGNIAQPGKGQFTFNQQQLEQGIYFYSLIIDGFKINTRKMIIIR